MPSERYYVPTRGYDIQMTIKNLDFTNDLRSVTIVSSLSTAYQVVLLELLADPSDFILQDIFGTDPIKLNIRYLGQQGIPPMEQVDLELMYAKADSKIVQKQETPETVLQKERTPFIIPTVCRKPFKTMSTIVNEVYTGVTLRQILEDLAGKVKVSLEYDSDGENKQVIDQVCIPPTTFYKIIKEESNVGPDEFDGYLDKRFGLFEGVPGIFCQHDNKLYIKNLTKKLNKNQTFTVYQLSAGGERNEKIIDKSIDGKNFYTYTEIDNDFSANAKFAIMAPTLRYVIKPSNKLYYIIEQDLKTVCANYGLIYKNKTIQVDPDISTETRVRYYNDDTGYALSSTPFDSKVARIMSDLATVSIDLERNLPILNLMNVGEPVKFDTRAADYVDLSGKYILWSSELVFNKSGEWQSVARINLIRTNKKI